MAEAMFQPGAPTGWVADQAYQGLADQQSMMQRASQLRQNQQMEQIHQQQIDQNNILRPVHQAEAQANIADAYSKIQMATDAQNARTAAYALATPAQQAFNNILKITDARQRVNAALGWVNDYGQLANVKSLAPQFQANHDLVAKMFNDYQIQSRYQSAMEVQNVKNQAPTQLVKNAQAYSDALANGDVEVSTILKARMDKDAALFSPADRNEYLMLTHALANPPPGIDPSVIAARLEQLSGRQINTLPAPGSSPAPGGAPSGAPGAMPVPSVPVQAPAPGQASPSAPAAPTQAPSIAPIATAGAQRITPANKTQGQQELFKLQGLVHQGVDVLNELEGHPEYLGVKGQAGSVIADSLLPAIGIGSGNQGRVSARQKIGIFRDSLLKTIADLPRISQAEINDIKSNLPDTGWGSNLAADTTKLRNVLTLLGRKAQEEQKRLGTPQQ